MGRLINDKQAILDKLSEEPLMVLETAYVYAQNYVLYGEDITKAWTTAVQQSSIIQEVRHKAWMEAYDSFKKDYEKRLKADKKAMLEDLQQEITELSTPPAYQDEDYFLIGVSKCNDIIQQKINALT